MKRLFILYDAQCGLCRELKGWATRQPAYLDLVFLAAGTAEAIQTFPNLNTAEKPEELVVVSDEGGIYRDTSAYIMCLYALQNYREWAMRLSTPALMPLARQAFRYLSRNRTRLSEWLGIEGEQRLSERLQKQYLAPCDVTTCRSQAHCPFCRGAVRAIDTVHCPECGAIHHRDCWIANSYRCSIFGCRPDSQTHHPS